MALIARSEVPPILRARSAISLGHLEERSGLFVQQQVIVLKVMPVHVQWKFSVFKYRAKTSGSRWRRAAEIFSTASRSFSI